MIEKFFSLTVRKYREWSKNAAQLFINCRTITWSSYVDAKDNISSGSIATNWAKLQFSNLHNLYSRIYTHHKVMVLVRTGIQSIKYDFISTDNVEFDRLPNSICSCIHSVIDIRDWYQWTNFVAYGICRLSLAI